MKTFRRWHDAIYLDLINDSFPSAGTRISKSDCASGAILFLLIASGVCCKTRMFGYSCRY
jgi:hypothetical protein